MSEEEKEAIEILETLSCYGLSLKITEENIQAIDIVLDYIDKQDKIIHKMAEIIALNTCEKKLVGRNLKERIDIVIENIKKCISK